MRPGSPAHALAALSLAARCPRCPDVVAGGGLEPPAGSSLGAPSVPCTNAPAGPFRCLISPGPGSPSALLRAARRICCHPERGGESVAPCPAFRSLHSSASRCLSSGRKPIRARWMSKMVQPSRTAARSLAACRHPPDSTSSSAIRTTVCFRGEICTRTSTSPILLASLCKFPNACDFQPPLSAALAIQRARRSIG